MSFGAGVTPFVPLLLAFAAMPSIAEENFSFPEAQAVLKTYCSNCHAGKTAVAGFDLEKFGTMESILEAPRKWNRALLRVRDGEMPPKGAPAPPMEQREKFVAWIEHSLRTAACADGISAGPAPIRRLNRNEYSATMRDLLNIHFNAGQGLPADGAGGEGFDNAAETLFLSPIHAEKYLEAAKQALDYGAKDPRSRARFFIAEPNENMSPEQAARKIIEKFLPRAFRRPVSLEDVERHLELFRAAQTRGETFNDSVLFALQGILISPHFLFRLEEPNPSPEPRLVSGYALATRLAYFLWGSMPDDVLFDLAAQGKLREPETLTGQVVRMLKDAKAREFAESFVEQWLGTRELGRDIKPDAKLFPEYYDAEIRSAMRYEPILFFQEILAQNHSLLNLLDSKFTISNNKLQRHYGLEVGKLRQQPVRVELPEGSHRGGLLGMAAVLAVSSYPQRTSPVLRGKWVLEAILGTPPPPPPPNVPELEEAHGGAVPKTLRERLMQHRENPTCAACHNRIDPLGFGLENYDVLGRWRTEDGGKPIDSKGELPDGTMFEGPKELKAVLLERKDLFIRNLTAKMFGYALGRGLTMEDYCTVEQVVGQLEKNEYSAHTLIQEIVLSVPFRYQAGMARPTSEEKAP
ncbi:MAG: DUF1592 domain-containing protein [Bryobacteraceae bacterium]